MLVLSRRIGESLIIQDDIKITFLGFKGKLTNKVVRLGIEAPKNVSVHREEVYYQIQQEKENKKPY